MTLERLWRLDYTLQHTVVEKSSVFRYSVMHEEESENTKFSRLQEAKIPLDQQQVEWLIGKFDKDCTATITYRLVCLGLL